jgi:serine/threonine protein kinase
MSPSQNDPPVPTESDIRTRLPSLDEVLPSDPDLRRELLGPLVARDLERRLEAGEAVRVEEYLARYPDLAALPDHLLTVIAAEVRGRRRREEVGIEEYLKRFPDYAGPLRARLSSDTGVSVPPVVDRPPARTDPVLPELSGWFGERYHIEKLLGRGNMGTVYLAYDTQLDRQVALKVPVGRDGVVGNVARFFGEARAAGRLHHGNICPVYESGHINGLPFLTMAYIPGVPLTVAYPPPVRDQRQAAGVVRTLARAMEAAHAHKVIHRDLKPANILVTDEGQPMITDFGLARRGEPDDLSGTVPGQVMGTPAYMAPEQAAGLLEAIGPCSDIYSLGVIFFELLTGKLPHSGEALVILQRLLQMCPPPRPSEVCEGIDPTLEAICLRALAARRQDRFRNMGEFAAALTAWLEGPPAPPRPAPSPPPDPRAVGEALALLRDWGWHAGLQRLQADIAACTDETRRATLQVLVGWLASGRGHYKEAEEQFLSVSVPGLTGWVLTGRAMVALRERQFAAAADLLNRAAAGAAADDMALQGTIAHQRGTLAYQQDRLDEALASLHTALERFGRGHFGTGRVLDTLGMVQAGRGNLALACEFYAAALDAKRSCGDDEGEALTHGQLGRLYLDWSQPDRADELFREGIAIARRIGDERGEAQLLNHRGQVRLAQGKAEQAEAFLEECIRSAEGRWSGIEAYGLKDRALMHLALGRPGWEEAADGDIDRAEMLFQQMSFAEGVSHVQRVRGLIRRAQGRTQEALRCLRTAAGQFELRHEHAEAARAHWEIARTLRLQGADAAQAAPVLLAALQCAERSRRGPLVAELESELRDVAELEQVRHDSRRLRGGVEVLPGTDLFTGATESVTVLVLQWQLGPASEWSNIGQDFDVEVAGVLSAGGVSERQYHGQGLLAVVRGPGHARRAVEVAQAVTRHLRELNRPRRLLGWPLWLLGIGVSSGTVWIGNRGSYQALDGTAVGEPVRQALALALQAEPDLPRIDESTRRLSG